MDDMISRKAVIDAVYIQSDDDGWWTGTVQDMEELLKGLPSVQPERMTNRQWIDFLSAQFDISRTSAKEMFHGMMQWKKEDNFKKMFNGGKT